MAAISKNWVTIADAAVDPDSPGDATLMTGIRDNLVHLREWLGASFFAGAVQDHNHDGSNSALIQVGPNLLRNGSFEDGTAGWTVTTYTGGSSAVSTSTRHHGAKSLSFTSTVLANGGGDAVSNEFIPVAEGARVRVDGYVSASGANVSSRAQVIWYDAAQSQISAVNIFDFTNTPTTARHFSGSMLAPANARYVKVKIIGGVPGAGSATGSVFFDGLFLASPTAGLSKLIEGTVSSAAQLDIVMTSYTTYKNKRLLVHLIPATDGTVLDMRVSANGGSSFDAGAADYTIEAIVGGATTTANTSGMTLSAGGLVGNGANEGLIASIDLFETNDGAQWTRINWVGATIDSAATPVTRFPHGAASRRAAQITDAVRFFFNSGNIASGHWQLYGWN